MKHLKTFEGLTDKMKPKSEEEIDEALLKMTPEEQLEKGCHDGLMWLVLKAFENGADINKEVWKGMTYGYAVLSDAAHYGFYQIVKYLIEVAKVPVTYNHYNSLQEHSYGNNKRMLKLLDKHLPEWKEPQNESLRDHMKPKSEDDIDKVLGDLSPSERLNKAARMGLYSVVKTLIDNGFDLNGVDDSDNYLTYGENALIWSSLGDYYDIVELLINSGVIVTRYIINSVVNNLSPVDDIPRALKLLKKNEQK